MKWVGTQYDPFTTFAKSVNIVVLTCRGRDIICSLYVILIIIVTKLYR